VVGMFTSLADDDPAASSTLLLVTAFGIVKRLERPALNELASGRAVMKLTDRDRLVAAVACTETDEVVLVTSDAQALRTPVAGVSIQGPAAKGVAGMALKGNARVVGAGIAIDGAVVVSVTDLGTAKATAIAELPSKGRGGGGVRVTKFKDEQRLDLAWIGIPDRIVAIVGQSDAPTKPANAPESVAIRPTRRDGASSPTPHRILAVGTLRW
jgi:DNA gyrase subunit A